MYSQVDLAATTPPVSFNKTGMLEIQVFLEHGIGVEGTTDFLGVARLSEQDRSLIKQKAGVRHAAHFGLASCLLEELCRVCLRDSSTGTEHIGLLCNGGPWNLDAAERFVNRSLEAGPQFVNPLTFPATLPSATPCSVAAAVGIGAFALAVGHDELAFFDVLRRAKQFIAFGFAREVVAAGVCVDGPALRVARDAAGMSGGVLDISLGLLMSCAPPNSSQFALVDAEIGSNSAPWPEIKNRYEAVDESGRVVFSLPTPLEHGTALSATGAILCAAALRRESSDGLPAYSEFVVSYRKRNVTGAALFKRLPT